MRFDLTDLRLFAAVVDAGSISKGAAAVNLALASASARVTGMEAALGAPLLERQRRGVVPTSAGLVLLSHARLVAGQMERLRGDLRAFSTGFRGEIRMLSNTAGLVDLLPRALGRFLAAHPGVDVTVEERTSAEIAVAVAEGRFAFGVVAATDHLEGLAVRPLAVDRLTAVVASTHPFAARDAIGFEGLLAEPFVGLSAGALHDHLAQQAARLGRRIAYRVRLRSFDGVIRLVATGVGVGVLPLAAVERHRMPGVRDIRLTDAWAARRLLVCARDFAALSAHARLLVEEIERQASLALARPVERAVAPDGAAS